MSAGFSRSAGVIEWMIASTFRSSFSPSRKRRIAAGSGTDVSDVNRVLRQNEQMQKLFRQMSGGGKKKGKRRRNPVAGMPGMGGGMPGMPF